jgi:16S rRNA (adenine1518-N6/adenine1519-N6)-dimethyltransferase
MCPPEAFDIKPKVTSSFIRMSPLRKSLVSDDEMKNFFEIVDLSFMSRRKNIKNNLKSKKIDWDSLQIDNQLRPEDLSLESYLKIAREIAKI